MLDRCMTMVSWFTESRKRKVIRIPNFLFTINLFSWKGSGVHCFCRVWLIFHWRSQVCQWSVRFVTSPKGGAHTYIYFTEHCVFMYIWSTKVQWYTASNMLCNWRKNLRFLHGTITQKQSTYWKTIKHKEEKGGMGTFAYAASESLIWSQVVKWRVRNVNMRGKGICTQLKQTRQYCRE